MGEGSILVGRQHPYHQHVGYPRTITPPFRLPYCAPKIGHCLHRTETALTEVGSRSPLEVPWRPPAPLEGPLQTTPPPLEPPPGSALLCSPHCMNDVTGPQRAVPKVASPAPDFAGIAVSKNEFTEISLATFKGKYLVLFFYPMNL